MPQKPPYRGGHPANAQNSSRNNRTSRLIDPQVRERLELEARERILANAQTTLDRPTLESIVAMMNDGNYPEVIAQKLGIPAPTFRQWLAAGERALEEDHATTVGDPLGLKAELYVRTMQAAAGWEIEMVGDMMARIRQNRRWEGHMTMLERRFPQRWGKRDRQASDALTFEQILNEWRRQAQSEFKASERRYRIEAGDAEDEDTIDV